MPLTMSSEIVEKMGETLQGIALPVELGSMPVGIAGFISGYATVLGQLREKSECLNLIRE